VILAAIHDYRFIKHAPGNCYMPYGTAINGVAYIPEMLVKRISQYSCGSVWIGNVMEQTLTLH
jgi:hypothetical protein